MKSNHRTPVSRVAGPGASRRGVWPPLGSSPASISRQLVSASDGRPGDRVLPTPEPRTVAGANSYPDAESSHLVVGYGGQESILPDDLSAGLIAEGELAPAWRAMKRGIAQAIRRRRAETFDEIVLANARWVAFTTGIWLASMAMSALIVVSADGSRMLTVVLLWAVVVFAALFLLNLPRLGRQEFLAERDREARAAVETAVSP